MRRSNPAIELQRVLQPDDLIFEFFLNALRLKDGVSSELFSQRSGLSMARLHARLDEACRKGLMSESPARLMATPLGFRFLNDLQMIFLGSGAN